MTETITIREASYHLVTSEANGQWRARAERADRAERFGIECTGSSAEEARTKLVRWLEWQDAHAVALDELQRAEQAYHRTILGSAFAAGTEGPGPTEMQKE